MLKETLRRRLNQLQPKLEVKNRFKSSRVASATSQKAKDNSSYNFFEGGGKITEDDDSIKSGLEPAALSTLSFVLFVLSRAPTAHKEPKRALATELSIIIIYQ